MLPVCRPFVYGQESDALCNTSRSALCCSAVFTHHDTRLTRQRKSSLYGSMVAGSIVLKSEKPPPAKRCFFCGLFNKTTWSGRICTELQIRPLSDLFSTTWSLVSSTTTSDLFSTKNKSEVTEAQNYRKSDDAINKNSPNIVYRFHNEIIEITLEDYLKENPDKTEHDFAELKALSDQIYYEQDRARERPDPQGCFDPRFGGNGALCHSRSG